MLMEEELVKVATSMPEAEFLRITRRLTRVISGSADDVGLCAATRVVHAPVRFVRRHSEVPGPGDHLLLNDLNDPAATPIG